MRLQWKLSLLGGTLLVAVAAWFAHVYVIGGWCGYYDGGPTGGRYSFCEQHVQSSNGDTWIEAHPDSRCVVVAPHGRGSCMRRDRTVRLLLSWSGN